MEMEKFLKSFKLSKSQSSVRLKPIQSWWQPLLL